MERVNSPVASPLHVVSDIYGLFVTVGPVITLPVLLGFACPVGIACPVRVY